MVKALAYLATIAIFAFVIWILGIAVGPVQNGWFVLLWPIASILMARRLFNKIIKEQQKIINTN